MSPGDPLGTAPDGWPDRIHELQERAASVGHVGLTAYGCETDEAERFAQRAPRFGITPTIIRAPLCERNAHLAIESRSVSVGHAAVVAERELRALRHLGVEHLSTRSIGVDHIDAEAAVALGIEVEAVGYEPDGVADFAVMLILMAVRNARQVLDSARGGDLRLGARTRDMGDLTVGVVGAGRIGRAVIRRLHGFGCQVLVSTRGDVAGLDAPIVPLDTLLRRSDVVTLHVPLDAANRHFIGAGEIARMRTGAVLVNTSRGALVDTAALLAALESWRLGGAALDVIEGEGDVVYRDWRGRPLPHRPLRRLLEMPNVIVTPHCAFHTTRALDDTVDRTLAACLSNEGNHTDAQTDDRHPVRGLLRGA